MADETNSPQPATPPPATPPPPAAAAPPAKPADRPKKPFEKRQPPRGDGPRKHVPRLDSDVDYKQKTAPNVRDLDAEIADELEAALKDMDAKSLYSADDSKRARDQAAAQADHGRKKGKVISIHGARTSSSTFPAAADRGC